MLLGLVPAARDPGNQRTLPARADLGKRYRTSAIDEIPSALEWVSITSSFTAVRTLNLALNETRQKIGAYTARLQKNVFRGRPRLGRSTIAPFQRRSMSRAVKHGVT